MPRVAIVDYGIGNLRSAQKAFEHIGVEAYLTADHDLIAESDGVVLPGVGAFAPCMAALRKLGLDNAVLDAISSGQPFMGICIGMQMLFAGSDEAPGVPGLGVFKQRVRWLSSEMKKPQMQWNTLAAHTTPNSVHTTPNTARDGQFPLNTHPMFNGLDNDIWVYFVHSLAPEHGDNVVAVCDYGGSVTAAVACKNVWGVQFHPEKSSKVGLRILENFARMALK